jgi:cysteine-rich repeat protein
MSRLWFGLCLLMGCRDIQQSHTPIVGGLLDEARPYVVGVGFGDIAICTGTLISTRTVLTAAHCSNPSKVFFGADVRAPALSIVASQRISHPGFSPSFSNDLQLLFLDEDAPVQPAPLFRQDIDAFVGEEITLVGFGVTTPNTQADGYKRSVVVTLDAVGPATLSGGFVDSIDETQLYYQDPLRNTCTGDSGGPSFLIQLGVEHHIGVTSFGDPGCSIDGVNARSDLAQLTSFLQPQIDLFEGGNPCKNDGTCNEACNTDGQVLDPDCQSLHCGPDALCALACVSPRDVDCDEPGVNHCASNGVCDPTCAALDPDCEGLCGAGDQCVLRCASPDPDCVVGACGDGVLHLNEACDDGDLDDTDACDSSCERAGCGDGIVNNSEECDDGNTVGDDGCDLRCKQERCGDRLIQGDEACDDADEDNDDGCTQSCQIPECGDGFIQVSLGELCDDGNEQNGDGCDANCVSEICGDLFVAIGEDCDDGNQNNGDGCSDDCQTEFTGGSCQTSPTGAGLWWMLLLMIWSGTRSRRGWPTDWMRSR